MYFHYSIKARVDFIPKIFKFFILFRLLFFKLCGEFILNPFFPEENKKDIGYGDCTTAINYYIANKFKKYINHFISLLNHYSNTPYRLQT